MSADMPDDRCRVHPKTASKQTKRQRFDSTGIDDCECFGNDPLAREPNGKWWSRGHASTIATCCTVYNKPGTVAGMGRLPNCTDATQTSNLSAAALLALFDRYVATIPDSNGYIVNVLSPANDVDLSVASGLSEVATSTKVSATQPSRITSVTKTFTAAVVLRLAEMKQLALHDSIEQHASPALIEMLKSGGYDTSAITIKQLLQHSSGIADYAGNAEKYQGAFQQAVLSNPSRKWTRAAQVEFAVKHYGPAGEPGSEFHYSDTGYILLGDIIEQVTKQTYAAAMRSILRYSELGLDSTYLEESEPVPDPLLPQAHTYVGGADMASIDPSYDLFGGGGLVSTVQDVSKFFVALFNGSIFEYGSTLDLMLGIGQPILAGSGGEPAHMSLYPRMIGSEPCFGHSGFTGITALYFPSLQTSVTFTVQIGRASCRERVCSTV